MNIKSKKIPLFVILIGLAISFSFIDINQASAVRRVHGVQCFGICGDADEITSINSRGSMVNNEVTVIDSQISGIRMDSSGNLWVGENLNLNIVITTPDGNSQTVTFKGSLLKN